MLLEFTVGNFLSFKEKKTFSLEAGGISELKDNVVKFGKYKALRSAVMYGANSSGKSNFIKALEFMITTIKNSSKLNSTDQLNVSPFLLNSLTENQPSFFEILFVTKNVSGVKRYRYGFEVDNNKVHSEWLYLLNERSKKEELCFVRNNDGIGVTDSFSEAKGIEEKTRENGLFISLADQFNSKTANAFMKAVGRINVLSGIEHKTSIKATNVLYDDEVHKLEIEHFIEKLDLGFNKFWY